MSNTSNDNFERIAEDIMDLLICALSALKEEDHKEQLLVSLVISKLAADICTRAIALAA